MLERVNDPDLSPEDLAEEIKRSRAVNDISDRIINNARVQIDAMKLIGGTTQRSTQHFLGEGDIQ